MAFDVGAIVARMKLDMTGWRSGLATVKADATALVGNIGGVTASLHTQIAAANQAGSALGNLSGRMKEAGRSSAMLSGLLGGIGAGAVAKQILDTAASTERLNLTLGVLLRSPQEGDKMLSWVDDYASIVVAKMTELRQSALTLTAVFGQSGREAVQSWLPVVADLSAQFNISTQEITAGLVRMLSGGAAAADLFRERGILQAFGFKPGEQAGPEETKRRVLENYLASDSTLRGMASKLSATWDGTISMIVDKWQLTTLAIMNSGPFQAMKEQITKIDQAWNRHFDQIVGIGSQYGPLAVKIGAVTAGLVALKVAGLAAVFALGSILGVVNTLLVRIPMMTAEIAFANIGMGAFGVTSAGVWAAGVVGAGIFVAAIASVGFAIEMVRSRWTEIVNYFKGFSLQDLMWGGKSSAAQAPPARAIGFTPVGGPLPAAGQPSSALGSLNKGLLEPFSNSVSAGFKAGADQTVKDWDSFLATFTTKAESVGKSISKSFTDATAMAKLDVGTGGDAAGEKTAKKRAAALAETLEQIADSGRALYTSLDPVREILAQTADAIYKLTEAGRDDAQTMKELAARTWDAAQKLTPAQFTALAGSLRSVGFESSIVAVELQKIADKAAALKAVEDAAEEMARTIADMRNVPEVIGKTVNSFDGVRGMMSGIGQSISNIGGDMKSRILSTIGAVVTGIMSVVMAYVAMQVAAAAAAATAAAAWIAILGPIAIVLAAIEALLAVFMLFGKATKEATSGWEKVAKEMKDSVSAWADDLTDSIVDFVATGKSSFREFANSVIEDMLRITIRWAIVQPALEFVGLKGSAKGNIFSGGDIVPFARGGVVTRPTIFPMRSGTGLMGEAGPEAIMPLRRGAGGRLGVEGSAPVINIIDQRSGGEQISVSKTAGPNGEQQFNILVRDAVQKMLHGGDLDGALRSNFRLARRAT